jgi:hypothetical protein
VQRDPLTVKTDSGAPLILDDQARAGVTLVGMYGRDKRIDFSVVVKSRGKLPNPWRWEIYRAGRSTAVAQSSLFFTTMTAAKTAGKQALADLFRKHGICD